MHHIFSPSKSIHKTFVNGALNHVKVWIDSTDTHNGQEVEILNQLFEINSQELQIIFPNNKPFNQADIISYLSQRLETAMTDHKNQIDLKESLSTDESNPDESIVLETSQN